MTQRMKLGGRRAQLEGFAFVAPFLLLYLFLLIYPLLRGILLSFRRADPFGDGRFVGLDNYARLLADPVFHQSMLNTFMVTLMIVPVLTVIALALALALNRATRGAAVFRGIFFSSSVLSVTIVTLIWRFVLAPDAGPARRGCGRRSAGSRCRSSAIPTWRCRRWRSPPSGGRSGCR